jgi:hypothetical protein
MGEPAVGTFLLTLSAALPLSLHSTDGGTFFHDISGEDRGQAALLPAAIEDYVAADAPVRVIDAFVSGLDAR